MLFVYVLIWCICLVEFSLHHFLSYISSSSRVIRSCLLSLREMGGIGIYMAVPQGAHNELTWYPNVRPLNFLPQKKKSCALFVDFTAALPSISRSFVFKALAGR